MPKEENTASAGKGPATVAVWLAEIEAHLGELKFGRIVISVYKSEITGISITHDIRAPERAARAEPPEPASGKP